jgi:hypothetical protein
LRDELGFLRMKFRVQHHMLDAAAFESRR